MDPIRRQILKTGAAATAMAAAPRVFAQTDQGGGGMSFYEKGAVRIHYAEAGSGFPLLLIAGSPPVRSKSTGRGMHTPTTISV